MIRANWHLAAVNPEREFETDVEELGVALNLRKTDL